MRRIWFVILLTFICFAGMGQGTPTRTIFAYGGGFTRQFMSYVITLTKKENPKICFLPTATGDNANTINQWYTACEGLPMRGYVQRAFVASYTDSKTFEDNLLGMDAIIVGGGNTLNMMAIWKAQGIDTVLRKAYNKGIILGGGSAGSLCWFQGGTTDSRPKDLSIVKCLGFIQTSHCPHYHSEPLRKPLYFDNILQGRLSPGYAIDDKAGIVFENEQYVRTVAIDDKSNAYYVSVVNGQVDEKLLPVTEILK
ncbi:Type 1 glutamine amidotransferase-like domain-containing protein [Mucilaginibacter sp. X4EP1]|uniref:Type 1 glutamine amidotransferase-like domain-containing protein n=1 Tax=Mucilaginibacter sp. X4EP1 TaxID=2723092 RepID=UPI002166E0A7|nr:peptidase E [Mucilaginibacter sp. X4EP1]MCS3816327.1 peptidase E [Mucilaginibacter sp. X4EP1]